MIAASLFLLAQVSPALFGAGFALHPSVRRLGPAAGLGAAFGLGSLLLALEATLFSIAGLAWSVARLALPLLVLSLVAGFGFGRLPVEPGAGRRSAPRFGAALVAWLSVALALLVAFAFLFGARQTSSDFGYFWGVKAVAFANARGIDAAFLAFPFSAHGGPAYPPLVPIHQAWGILVSGEMPWSLVPATSLLWLLAAIPIVLALLRTRLDADDATAVTAFWSVALAQALASSYSGGNADAPILFYATVAGVVLLTEDGHAWATPRLIAGLALAGAALSKMDGIVTAGLLSAGVVARDLVARRPRALARALPLLAASGLAVGVWFLYQHSAGLPPGYRRYDWSPVLRLDRLPAVLRDELANLGAGTRGLSWLVPIAFLAASWRRLTLALPVLVVCAGSFAVFTFLYLHSPSDPHLWISWTLPRTSQVLLSLLVLAAGLARQAERNLPMLESPPSLREPM